MNFDAAQAKIGHAHWHLERLNEVMTSFFGSHTYPIGSKYDPETSEITLYATGYEGAPLIDWGLRIGDYLHNLRSALDHMVWQFALDCLGREPTDIEARRIQFPIETEEDRFKSARVRHYISTVHFAWLDNFQPYHGGDRANHSRLAVLARLNNIDKHRVIHTAALMPAGAKFEFGETVDVESYGEMEIFTNVPMEKETPIGRIGNVVAAGHRPYIQAQGPFQFRVVFDDPAAPVIHHKEIGDVLNQLGEMVDAVVSTTEAKFAPPPPDDHSGSASPSKG